MRKTSQILSVMVLVVFALQVSPALGGMDGMLTADLEVTNILGTFPAVLNPDYGSLYSAGLVNTSGTFTGDYNAPTHFSYTDLPLYTIVPYEADLVVDLPVGFVPWDYADPLFEGGGTSMANRRFSLAPVGNISLELEHTGGGVYDVVTGSSYEYSATSHPLSGEVNFGLPPGGMPNYLWYGVNAVNLTDGAGVSTQKNDGSWTSGWPGTIADKNFFPPEPSNMESVPVILLGYESEASAEADAMVEHTMGGESSWDNQHNSDWQIDNPAFAIADAHAEIWDPVNAWVHTTSEAQAEAYQNGDEVGASAFVQAWGDSDNGGDPDVMCEGGAGCEAGIMEGFIEIGTSDTVPLGQPGTLFVSLEVQGDGFMGMEDFHLYIWDEDTGDPLLEAWCEDGEWEVDIVTGQVLGFDMHCMGDMMGMMEDSFFGDLGIDVNFRAEAEIPEPASTVLLLTGGVLAMFRRRRKR